MRLTPDGKSLVTLGKDRRVIRWNLATATPEQSILLDSSRQFETRKNMTFELGIRLGLSNDGAFLAWRSESDKMVHVMDLKTGKDACVPLKVYARGMQFSPDSKVLAVFGDKNVFYFWRWQTERNPKPLLMTGAEPYTYHWSFTPDSKQLLLCDMKPVMLHSWDVAAGKETSSFPIHGLDGRLDYLTFSPDRKFAVAVLYIKASDEITNVHVIDFEQRQVSREIKVDLPACNNSPPAFSPDGHVLVVGESSPSQQRSAVKLIEFATGETIAMLKGHHSGVSAFQFTPDGRTLYSGSADSTILKWDATARHGKGPSTPSAETAWEALAQEASKAYPARWDFVDSPKEAVALLRKKIVPARKLDRTEVLRMVDGLNSDKFQERNKASDLLKSLGYSVELHLRTLIESEKRPEVKERLQKALDELGGSSFLRIQRALQVLESIGNDDAKQLLRELADGATNSMLTKEAASVVKRMAK